MKQIIRYKNKLPQLIKIADRYHYQREFDKHKNDPATCGK